jgi:hypothetical protein
VFTVQWQHGFGRSVAIAVNVERLFGCPMIESGGTYLALLFPESGISFKHRGTGHHIEIVDCGGVSYSSSPKNRQNGATLGAFHISILSDGKSGSALVPSAEIVHERADEK